MDRLRRRRTCWRRRSWTAPCGPAARSIRAASRSGGRCGSSTPRATRVDGPFYVPGAGTRRVAGSRRWPAIWTRTRGWSSSIPSSRTAVERSLDAPVVPAPPAWVGDERVLVVTGTDDALTSSVIDTASGDAVPGPGGARLVATSGDARIVAVARPGRDGGDRPRDLGLAGRAAARRSATIDPPDGALAVTSLALDMRGVAARDRVADRCRFGPRARLRPGRPVARRRCHGHARGPPAAVVAWSR